MTATQNDSYRHLYNSVGVAAGSCPDSSNFYTDLDPRREYHLCNLFESRTGPVSNIPNTWGFSRKINEFTCNNWTYNVKEDEYKSGMTPGYNDEPGLTTVVSHKVCTLPEGFNRDALLKVMRVGTRILDVLGYIPVASTLSGSVRIFAGIIESIVINRRIRSKYIVGDFKKEFRWTARGQILRGFTELVPVIGQAINLYLDISYYRFYGPDCNDVDLVKEQNEASEVRYQHFKQGCKE